MGVDIQHDIIKLERTLFQNTLGCCIFCPIDWGSDQGSTSHACIQKDSLYYKWDREKDISKKAQLAKQIANLPEREIDQNEK